MVFEKVVEQIPTWALPYIINDDASGLNDEEIELVKEFYSSYEKNGLHIEIVSPHDDEYGYFSHYPAFGLPTNVIDCDVLYTEKK